MDIFLSFSLEPNIYAFNKMFFLFSFNDKKLYVQMLEMVEFY